MKTQFRPFLSLLLKFLYYFKILLTYNSVGEYSNVGTRTENQNAQMFLEKY